MMLESLLRRGIASPTGHPYWGHSSFIGFKAFQRARLLIHTVGIEFVLQLARGKEKVSCDVDAKRTRETVRGVMTNHV